MTHNDKEWKTWFDSDAPEEESIPNGYDHSLDTFRRLLLIRSVFGQGEAYASVSLSITCMYDQNSSTAVHRLSFVLVGVDILVVLCQQGYSLCSAT